VNRSMRHLCVFMISLGALSLISGGCASYNALILQSREKSARDDFQKQNYDSAVNKYHFLSLHHPDPEKRQFFQMQKGLSLYILRSYHDSQKAFESYLRQYPEGKYVDEARSYLTKIESIRSERERNYTLKMEQIRGDVELLHKMIDQDPYNARVHYDLANKLWELGKYNEAAQHYLRAGEIDAALKENELLRNRLMIDDEGKVVPITPRRQRAMDRERNPLVIFDINTYKQRIKPDYLGASKAFQTVTGKVRNQSKNVLRSVLVSVNFYNVHYELLDTQNYYIGTMGPNEVRAFLVKGQNYDNLYNIDDVEFNTTYQ